MQTALSAGFILAIVLWGVISPDTMGPIFETALATVTRNFGWFYLWVVLGMVVFVAFLAFSRYGNLKLGGDDDEPEFALGSWFSMLFAAGMGIGLVFFGVAEPISHYIEAPPGTVSNTPEAAGAAMRYTFFHWGIHPWAVYSAVALAIAFFQYRRGGVALVSTVTDALPWPIVKHMGGFFNGLAVVATAFGVAASLGVGALQINNGLNTVLRASERGVADRHHRAGYCHVPWVGRQRRHARRENPFEHQHDHGCAAGAGRLHPWPDRGDHRYADQHAGQLRHRIRPHEPARDAVPRQHLGWQLDHLLLGLVDFVVAVRGSVHRPRLAWPHDP